MPVVTKSSLKHAFFEEIADRITFLKQGVVTGQVTPSQEPTIISDPSVLKNIVINNEMRTLPEQGDAHDIHHLEFFLSNPAGAAGDIRIDDVKIVRNGSTIYNGGNRGFILEPGVQKRIGASSDVVDLTTDATVVTLDIRYNVAVKKQEWRQIK